jgi:methionine sulfoxide reductase heme-binding subunit
VTWSAVTWESARAGGFAAYVLLSLSVVVGLVLRNRWHSPRWPRLVTNELHGYLSLLALTFLVFHVLAVAVDPFTRFGLAEVLVPFVSHYRPLWMGLGIVALYLLLAVWATTLLRRRIGHRAWRRTHVLAFAVYAAATVHGLGTGSDTRTVWGTAVYVTSVTLVALLAGRRLLVPAGSDAQPRPLLAAGTAAGMIAAAAWATTGPYAAHWGSHAGGRHVRPVQVVAAPRVRAPAAHRRRPPSPVVRPPFTASFAGRVLVTPVNENGRVTVRIDGALAGATHDHLEILLHGVPTDDGGVMMEQSRVRMGTTTPFYKGTVTALRGSVLIASVRSPQQHLRLGIALQLGQNGQATGSVRGTGLAGTA